MTYWLGSSSYQAGNCTSPASSTYQRSGERPSFRVCASGYCSLFASDRRGPWVVPGSSVAGGHFCASSGHPRPYSSTLTYDKRNTSGVAAPLAKYLRPATKPTRTLVGAAVRGRVTAPTSRQAAAAGALAATGARSAASTATGTGTASIAQRSCGALAAGGSEASAPRVPTARTS